MIRRFAASLLTIFFLSGSVFADEDAAISQAQAAAEAWLKLTDEPAYGNSWDEAASVFKKAISSGNWVKALEQVRSPLGVASNRTLKSATFTRTLPGAPEGEYVVLQYQTQFESRAAVETITPMKEEDGTWRVSGYYIR